MPASSHILQTSGVGPHHPARGEIPLSFRLAEGSRRPSRRFRACDAELAGHSGGPPPAADAGLAMGVLHMCVDDVHRL